MEENNKVIIFEKKEIVLMFILVVVLIIISFTLGIRLGKKLSLTAAGVTAADVKTVELKSTLEEDVDHAVEKDAHVTDDEKLRKLMDESKAHLNDELGKFSTEDKPKEEAKTEEAPKQSSMVGKFTIQLGSYNTMEEAKQFAEGFTVRGYSPIINEVKIQGKGDWYRVSLGLFNTVEEAKAYVQAEQSLFSGQDHIITEIR
jgi:septal ring-binding cell division protein DamX